MIKQEYVDKIGTVLNDKVSFAFIFGSANTKYFTKKSIGFDYDIDK